MAAGGKREGAGRKALEEDQQKKAMTIYLPEPAQIELYAEASLNGLSVGELIQLWQGMYRRN